MNTLFSLHKQMDINTLRLIAGCDMEIWRLFSVLNKAMNAEFNMYKYELTFREIVKNNNTITYYLNGKPHRTDGPAVIGPQQERWYKYGELHRIGGPAVISQDGCYQQWIANGKVHRLDGAALILTLDSSSVSLLYHYIDGKSMNKSEWLQARKRYLNSYTINCIQK